MIIRVSKKQTRYSVVDNTGFEDPRLSYKAKGILAYFLTKPDNWKVNMTDLEKHATDGRDSIQTGLKELGKSGYASYKTTRKSNGQLAGKEWVIYEVPQTPKAGKSGCRSGSPINGFSDNRETRKSGNPQLVNTDTVVSTDFLESTECAAPAEKKSAASKKTKKTAPPSSAAPPPRLFAESEYADMDLFEWTNLFAQQLPELPDADPSWYLNRVKSWSVEKGGKSRDWLATAARFAREDYAKRKLVTLQPIKNGQATNTNGTGSLIDPDRTLAIAGRVLARHRSRS